MKVLVAQPGKIGDLVCTTPLFRTLAKSFGAPVDVIAGNFAADLLFGNSAVGKIYPRDVDPKVLQEQHYTHVLMLMPSLELWKTAKKAGIKNIFGTVQRRMSKKEKLFSYFILTKRFNFDFTRSIQEHYLDMAAALGAREIVKMREIYFSEEAQSRAARFFSDNNLSGKRVVGISVGAGKDFKKWGLDNFRRLVVALNADGFFVVGAGSQEERQEVESLAASLPDGSMFVNAAGLFSLQEFAAVARNFLCYIAGDTGPLYIADALGIPVVDLMGPCFAIGQHPQGLRAVIVGECKNSDHPKCYMMYSPNFRHDEYLRCMREIEFPEVWQGFKSAVKA